MKRSTAFLLSAVSLFFGVIIGFLISPVKHEIEIGNNIGDNIGNNNDNTHLPKKD